MAWEFIQDAQNIHLTKDDGTTISTNPHSTQVKFQDREVFEIFLDAVTKAGYHHVAREDILWGMVYNTAGIQVLKVAHEEQNPIPEEAHLALCGMFGDAFKNAVPLEETLTKAAR